VSGYWRMSLRCNNGGSLYLFTTSSEQTARAVLRTLTEETGCDRFYVELDGSDAADRGDE